MQRIRKISNLFKKDEEPTTYPDNFLHMHETKQERALVKVNKRLNHVKSMPLRSNKPTYRGGQSVPKAKIVHVDIPDPRPSTSSGDTSRSDPSLDLLPPPGPKLLEAIRNVRLINADNARTRAKVPPSAPPRPHNPHSSPNMPLPQRGSPLRAPAIGSGTAATKVPPKARVSTKEIPKPVQSVSLSKPNNVLPTPTKDHGGQFLRPLPFSNPQPSPQRFTNAQVGDGKDPRRGSFGADSDDSASVYSDQFTVDSVSVMTDESRRNIPYIRYHDARSHFGGDSELPKVPPTGGKGVTRNQPDQENFPGRPTVLPTAVRIGSKASRVLGTQSHRQYIDPMYFASKQKLPWQNSSPSRVPNVYHSTPALQTFPSRPVPCDNAIRRPQARPHVVASPTLHPPAIQQSLAKQSVKVTPAIGARRSCKAQVVIAKEATSSGELSLALNEPESVIPGRVRPTPRNAVLNKRP